MNPTRLSFGPMSPQMGGNYVPQQMMNGAPALNQASPANPGTIPGQQVAPQGLPNPSQGMGTPPSIMPPQQMPQPQPQPLPKSEHELILTALAKHLENSDHIEKMRHEILQHQAGMNEKP